MRGRWFRGLNTAVCANDVFLGGKNIGGLVCKVIIPQGIGEMYKCSFSLR